MMKCLVMTKYLKDKRFKAALTQANRELWTVDRLIEIRKLKEELDEIKTRRIRRRNRLVRRGQK